MVMGGREREGGKEGKGLHVEDKVMASGREKKKRKEEKE